MNYNFGKQFRCLNLIEIPVVTKVKGPSFPVFCLNFGERVAEKDVGIEQAQTAPSHNVLLTSGALKDAPVLK